jgi:hypothetical protein
MKRRAPIAVRALKAEVAMRSSGLICRILHQYRGGTAALPN